jgi:hypothetical protein
MSRTPKTFIATKIKLQTISYIKNDVNTPLNCQAKSNRFIGIFPPIVFDNWSGDLSTLSENNPEITLPVTHYGTLVANFKAGNSIGVFDYQNNNPLMLETILPNERYL